MTTEPAGTRNGTYEILIAGMQALNTKVTELAATVAAMVGRLDDFQRSVETRYMPRTEFEAALRESQDDRKEMRQAMVFREGYQAAQQETTRRLERLENGPQRLIGWAGVGIGIFSLAIGCAGTAVTLLGVVVTTVLWIILR